MPSAVVGSLLMVALTVGATGGIYWTSTLDLGGACAEHGTAHARLRLCGEGRAEWCGDGFRHRHTMTYMGNGTYALAPAWHCHVRTFTLPAGDVDKDKHGEPDPETGRCRPLDLDSVEERPRVLVLCLLEQVAQEVGS